MRWVSHVARMGRCKICTKFWSDNLKRPFRRPRYGQEDNIRTDLKEIGWCGVDWIH